MVGTERVHKMTTGFAVFVLATVIGANTIGLATYIPYLMSFMRATLDLTLTQLDGVFFIGMSMAVVGLTSYLGDWLSNNLGARPTAIIGSVIIGAGVITTRLTLGRSFILTIILMGGVTGVGCALTFPAALLAVTRWFSKAWQQQAIIGGGFGFGMFLAAVMQTLFVNPGNIRPDLDPYNTTTHEKFFTDSLLLWRTLNSTVFLGNVYLALGIAGSLLLFKPTQDEEQKPLTKDSATGGDEEQTTELSEEPSQPPATTGKMQKQTGQKTRDAAVNTQREDPNLGPIDLLLCRKNTQFYILWCIFFIYGIIYLFMISLYKSFGNTFIREDHYFMWICTAAALGYGVGRVFYQKFAAKCSVKVLYITIGAVNIFDMCAQLLFPMVVSLELKEFAYAAIMFSVFMQQSGMMTLMPIACARAFGTKYLSYNQALFYLAMIAPSIFAILPVKLAPLIGWTGVYLILCCIQLLGIILCVFLQGTNREN